MANILDTYGIREVADVTFYKLNSTGEIGEPVLYLDTLKVSTTELTAQNTPAKGGKGAADLIIWDYGKEITITLEDALFSVKSLAMIYGDPDYTAESTIVRKTIVYEPAADYSSTVYPPINATWMKPDGSAVSVPTTGTYYDIESGSTLQAATTTESPTTPVYTLTAGKRYFYTFLLDVELSNEVKISATTFPGTYYITGDTYARSAITGEDEFFQLIVPKAKMLSEATLTLEAEGDPTTFSIKMKVLRPKNKQMLKLVKYKLTLGTPTIELNNSVLTITNIDAAADRIEVYDNGAMAGTYFICDTELENLTITWGEYGDELLYAGSSNTVTLVAASGYTLPATITMTRGGLAYTGFTYNSTSGAITIPSADITGRFNIIASAGQCFVAGTLVMIANDGAIPIEEIAVGDVVRTYNEDTCQYGYSEVESIVHNENTTDIVTMALSNDVIITFNAYHPFLTVEGWKAVDNAMPRLTVGDKIVGGLEDVDIISIDRYTLEQAITTYNLKLKDGHVLLVGSGSNPVIARSAN